MNTLLVTFIIMALSFVGSALGLILRNQPIKGSWGHGGP